MARSIQTLLSSRNLPLCCCIQLVYGRCSARRLRGASIAFPIRVATEFEINRTHAGRCSRVHLGVLALLGSNRGHRDGIGAISPRAPARHILPPRLVSSNHPPITTRPGDIHGRTFEMATRCIAGIRPDVGCLRQETGGAGRSSCSRSASASCCAGSRDRTSSCCASSAGTRNRCSPGTRRKGSRDSGRAGRGSHSERRARPVGRVGFGKLNLCK